MIDYLVGRVQNVSEKFVTIDINGFGIALQTPQPEQLERNKKITMYTYLHWNQEKGPSLFGFPTALTRKVFLLIIDCPKIGPSIALSVLSQLSPGQFLEIITTQDDKKLSSVNGIGPKKAEQIIVQLKHKVQKLLSSGQIAIETQESFVQWQNVNDVLTSLNYSKQEINQVLTHLTEKYKSQNCNLDQLIRSALSYLSGKP